MNMTTGIYFIVFFFIILPVKMDEHRTTSSLEGIKLYNYTSCQFLVIAHRGASYYAPENTMAAFRLAHEMNADMIELDVQLSKDGIPVVIHEPFLEKTTSGRGRVSDFTLSELQEFNAGSWFSDRFENEKIPSLDEVLQWAAGKIAVNIEIKTEAVALGEGVEEKVIALVQNYEMDRYVIFSSFDPRAIFEVNRLVPGMNTGILYDRSRAALLPPSNLVNESGAGFFHVNWRWLNNRWLNDLKEHNIPVLTYTVNNERRMRQLIRRGVQGIFSDRPDLLKKAADSEFENRCSNTG
ncbi:MAG: glycerophosphodiester phosphodiesterase family protein [Balneolaceae bacterium]